MRCRNGKTGTCQTHGKYYGQQEDKYNLNDLLKLIETLVLIVFSKIAPQQLIRSPQAHKEVKRSFDDAYAGEESDDEGHDEGAAEKKAKLEREQVIRSEFEKRRGKITKKEMEEKEKAKKKEEEEALRSSKVKAAEFTGKKISGLEISQRESYLSLLETVIRNNYDKTSYGGIFC